MSAVANRARPGRNRPKFFFSDRAGSIFPVALTPAMDDSRHSQPLRSPCDWGVFRARSMGWAIATVTAAARKKRCFWPGASPAVIQTTRGYFSYHPSTQPELPVKFVTLHTPGGGGAIKSKYKMGKTRGITLVTSLHAPIIRRRIIGVHRSE